MYERFQKTKKQRKKPMAVWLAVLLFLLSAGQASAADRMLIPVGHTVGVKLFSRGVLVVGLEEGRTPAKTGGLAAGDVILTCNGAAVTSSEQFQSMVCSAAGDPLALQVSRERNCRTVTVQPRQTGDGRWLIGAWIRDSMAGIGTVTYYDPATGAFGALGHGITDTDTAKLMPFSSGSILPSTVKTVRRGESGAAGELKGSFRLEEQLGTLCANTSCGIFGTLQQPDGLSGMSDAVPVASADEVHDGPAVIRSNVEGDLVKEYAVEISRLSAAPGDSRNLMVKVTDPELLALTGGIVQGQSGSPILQDGKLVGAVTHVLLNDPTRGYGILIDTMLAAAEGK